MRADTSHRKKHPARSIAPGATLGRFRVVRVVSERPGLDAVVEAKAADGTRVALTVLGDAFDRDPGLRSATLKRVRARTEIEHPHLLPMRGPWQSSGRVFYATAPGRTTLADRLQDGPLEPEEALRITGQVAAVLELAAAKGLVHNDLTPAAIVLKESDALLGDFGVTSPPGRGCELLGRSGSIDYRSPEELRGAPARPRSSVYSLACILAECLTGAPPHRQRRPLLTLHAHLVEPPPRISAHGLPERIDAVIAKGMAKDPRERFRSPAQLVEAAGKALGVGVRIPVTDAERRQRAHEKAAVRERRRADRRERRKPVTRTLRRPARVSAWAAAALLISGVGGFATGSADWSGADRVPETSASDHAAVAAVKRHEAHQRKVEYLRAVGTTVDRLGEKRAKARHRLHNARLAARQASAANALAAAYEHARQGLPAKPPRPFDDAPLTAGLRDAERAYRELAAAARTSDGKAWTTAGRAAVRSEQRIKRSLAALRAA